MWTYILVFTLLFALFTYGGHMMHTSKEMLPGPDRNKKYMHGRYWAIASAWFAMGIGFSHLVWP